ncbi:dihydropteroate synthase [Croceicoccus naphthovorans]|uniref:dihydropteroate synthase n=1 Tax=Croceicoccus naphthovorans TaxID=1348774 RepID=A0A0G3XF83_9SPHN|nr:dihydropteroate synthase [Croceicoccus naphthovorans]AKM10180.1 dihydropteroate synthase [Croceicoccus naphthovorans]MBB3990583.1 dihydropteroate synthase [Croceicoccus naphthovorans]
MPKLYIQPLTFAPSPQVVEGKDRMPGGVRLAGTMVYAREFAILIRSDSGPIISREIVRTEDLAAALARLPAPLVEEGQRQWSNLRMAHRPLELQLGSGEVRTIRLDQPQVMGILNVTPDSFSDGGQNSGMGGEVDVEAAVSRGVDMLEAGAAIIDIGGESTRPGAKVVWEGDEAKRVVPVIERLANGGAAVSVDTRKAAVMEAALEAGARIVNDVSALSHDPRSAEVVADAQVPVVLMHAPGTGDDLHADANYGNVVLDVFDALRERRDTAMAAGIRRDNIVLDPGIGFGKSVAENLALLNALPLFHALGQPLLLGVSRKRFIGALSKEAPADQRLAGSLAVATLAADMGVQMFRVHDAAETMQAMHVWRGLRDGALTDFTQLPRD